MNHEEADWNNPRVWSAGCQTQCYRVACSGASSLGLCSSSYFLQGLARHEMTVQSPVAQPTRACTRAKANHTTLSSSLDHFPSSSWGLHPLHDSQNTRIVDRPLRNTHQQDTPPNHVQAFRSLHLVEILLSCRIVALTPISTTRLNPRRVPV